MKNKNLFFLLNLITTMIISFFPLVADDVISLRQKDFDGGTYLITKPGTYRLEEDISFNANSPAALKTDAYNAGFLVEKQYRSHGGLYEEKAYGIGFFAAIVITADGVILDLNGHTLEQSAEHALLQRFFAIIELANKPFIPGEGPHNFGGNIESGQGITIKNGKIGRSSHHGIHGNGNDGITIENVQFEDFEIAAVGLNGVRGLVIENCTAKSREDVPVLGIFSSARFLKGYLDYLVDSGSQTTLNIGGKQKLTARQVRDRLRQGINAVHEDLIVKGKPTIDPKLHPEEYALFYNEDGVVDGNCFGFLVNFYGEAVEGFAIHSVVKPQWLAQGVRFKNVTVNSLKGKVREVVAISNGGKGMADPVGAIFQVTNTHPHSKKTITITSSDSNKAIYRGNMVANAQALIAKAHLNGEFKTSGLETVHLNINQNVINWIEADPSTPQAKLSYLAPTPKNFVCNGDTMFHVNKGVMGFKFDAADGLSLENVSANNVQNLSSVGSDVCGYYTFSHPFATEEGCGGPKTRGFCLAGCKGINMSHCSVNKIVAAAGSAVGFDILTDTSDVVMDGCFVDGIDAGKNFHKNKGPNENPTAIAFKISKDAKNIVLSKIYCKNLEGLTGEKCVVDDSKKAKIDIAK